MLSSGAGATWQDNLKKFEVPSNKICDADMQFYKGGYNNNGKVVEYYKSYRFSGFAYYMVNVLVLDIFYRDKIDVVRNTDSLGDGLYYTTFNGYEVDMDSIDKYNTDVCVIKFK